MSHTGTQTQVTNAGAARVAATSLYAPHGTGTAAGRPGALHSLMQPPFRSSSADAAAHEISPELSSGGGDLTTGSRSRLGKRRPHVPNLFAVPISRDESRGVAGPPVWLQRPCTLSSPAPTPATHRMHVCIAPAPLHPNQYHTLSQKTDPTYGAGPATSENGFANRLPIHNTFLFLFLHIFINIHIRTYAERAMLTGNALLET